MICIAEDPVVVCPLPSWILGRSLFIPLYKHHLWHLVRVRIRVRVRVRVGLRVRIRITLDASQL